jgi:hypothetical protein
MSFFREQTLGANEQTVELCRKLAAYCPAVFNAKLAMAPCNLSSCLSGLGHRDCLAAFNVYISMSLNSLSLRVRGCTTANSSSFLPICS